jgi:hypothetical protein
LFYYFCPADYVGWLSRERLPIIFVCLFFARDARELGYFNPRHVVCPALLFHQPSSLSGSIEPSAGLSTTICSVCQLCKFNSAKKKKKDKLLLSKKRKSEALNRFESNQAAKSAVATTYASAANTSDQQQQRQPRPRLSDFVPPSNPRRYSFHPCSTLAEQPTTPG